MTLQAWTPAATPAISVVVIAHDMARELPRTLASLSVGMQQGVEDIAYEVIVMDNGSAVPVPAPADAGVSVIRIDDAPPSPAMAVNVGLARARGELVGVLIDGARMASPGLIRYAALAARLHPRPVIATLGFHLGPDVQMQTVPHGYDAAAEDELLANSGWEEDGYRLFRIASLAGSSAGGWFRPIAESNGLFLTREMWAELGGYDEHFLSPGGGLVNLDTYARACELPDSQVIVVLGEGTFHQVHGGVATNARVSPWESLHAEYVGIRGHPFRTPEPDCLYVGRLHADSVPFIRPA